MLRESPALQHRITRIVPHVIDTLFLISGIALVVSIKLPILQSSWLLAKLAGLIIYIGLGMIALRRGRTREVRLLAFIGALATFAYIVGVAFSKSPASWLVFTS